MQDRHESKEKFLDAAIEVVRRKGYTAATIDDICAVAKLTKGSFFHHFSSKEDLGLNAAAHWGSVTGALFAASTYKTLEDPLDRLLAYIDLRLALIEGEVTEFTCFLGTMVQDTFETFPALRDACYTGISEHAFTLTEDIAAAKSRYAPDAAWTATSLGLYTQAVIQGAFVLAKAEHGTETARDCLRHLRRYVEMLFGQPAK